MTKSILDGNIDFKLKTDLELFKEFTKSSNKFVEYKEHIEKNKSKKKLLKINNIFSILEKNIKIIKGFLVD